MNNRGARGFPLRLSLNVNFLGGILCYILLNSSIE